MSEEITIPIPRETAELVGHQREENQVLNLYNAGRFHHAWLVSGPQGVGKATLCYRIARFLLAAPKNPREDKGPELFGDTAANTAAANAEAGNMAFNPDHPVFRKVAQQAHPDLKILEPTVDEKTGKQRSDITVQQVRDVSEFMSKTPAESAWRVVVVDSIDTMNINGLNALLKVLEEPPEQAVLLLVCHNPGRILPTILSRCAKLALKPVAFADVRDYLAAHRPDLTDSQRERIAHLAQGRIGRACWLAESESLDVLDRINELLLELPHLKIPEVHQFADGVARAGKETEYAILRELLAGWYGRLLRYLVSGDSSAAMSEMEAAIFDKAQDGAIENWIEARDRMWQRFEAAERLNLDQKEAVLECFIDMEQAARAGRIPVFTS